METLFGDSQLVIRQMTGEYKCNKMTTNSKKERSKNNIYPLYEEAIVLVKYIERISVGGGLEMRVNVQRSKVKINHAFVLFRVRKRGDGREAELDN